MVLFELDVGTGSEVFLVTTSKLSSPIFAVAPVVTGDIGPLQDGAVASNVGQSDGDFVVLSGSGRQRPSISAVRSLDLVAVETGVGLRLFVETAKFEVEVPAVVGSYPGCHFNDRSFSVAVDNHAGSILSAILVSPWSRDAEVITAETTFPTVGVPLHLQLKISIGLNSLSQLFRERFAYPVAPAKTLHVVVIRYSCFVNSPATGAVHGIHQHSMPGNDVHDAQQYECRQKFKLPVHFFFALLSFNPNHSLMKTEGT